MYKCVIQKNNDKYISYSTATSLFIELEILCLLSSKIAIIDMISFINLIKN